MSRPERPYDGEAIRERAREQGVELPGDADLAAALAELTAEAQLPGEADAALAELLGWAWAVKRRVQGDEGS